MQYLLMIYGAETGVLTDAERRDLSRRLDEVVSGSRR